MIKKALSLFAKLLPSTVIRGSDGSPYLTKHTIVDLGKKIGRVHLHRFHRGDEDQECHNHPWHGVSLILAGGYREERRVDAGDVPTRLGYFVSCRDCLPGDVSRIRPDTFHRVDLLDGDCWTLFASGPVVQKWGFWNRDTNKFTPHKEFVKDSPLKGNDHLRRPQ